MLFIILIIMLAVGFGIQYFLGLLQIKHFTKHYTALRKKGRVAIGRRPSVFQSGTIVLIQINGKNVIEEVRYIQGVTVFAKFKQLSGLEGIKIDRLTADDVAGYNKLLVRAILDARHTFNVIQSGGDIPMMPSPLKRVVNSVNSMFKKRGVN